MRVAIFIFLFFVLQDSLQAQELSVSLNKRNKECELGIASVEINSGVTPFQILWSDNSTGSGITNLNVGDYWVKITDANLLDTTIFFTIEQIDCEPIVANHFTPNGDLYNDEWNIARLQYFPDIDLYVYNRWGQQIHRQSGQYTPWDGKTLGLLIVPDGTYFYILYFDWEGKKKFIKGTVNIIR